MGVVRFIKRIPVWTIPIWGSAGFWLTLQGFRYYQGGYSPYGYRQHSTSASKPFTIFNASKYELGQMIHVVPYGVLGTQLTVDKDIVQNADAPSDERVVIVDPAGLHHIQGVPAGASGAAGAIYKWIGPELLPLDEPFHASIRQTITGPTKACRRMYGSKAVVHAVGPDLRADAYNLSEDRTDKTDPEGFMAATRDLSMTYQNIFKEFAAHLQPDIEDWRADEANFNPRQPWGTLRMLPVSGGIFSGKYKERMPEMTARAIIAAFDNLPQVHRRALAMRTTKFELCIFDENELLAFRREFDRLQKNLRSAATTYDSALETPTWRPQFDSLASASSVETSSRDS
ncbi:hypothetical protein DIPPA_23802 [Diplonema papillatum]|nr:hypothetical protein DIPPA_23802 [Diplonema papillatum]